MMNHLKVLILYLRNHMAFVKLYLFKLSRRQCDGWTPLHLAAMFGKVEVVRKLLQAGASTTIKGTDGQTPENISKRFRFHQLADMLNR